MQLKHFALSALVASAVAKPAEKVSIPPSDLAIIATVLPSSALAYIQTAGQGAFSKKVASEFKAGETPGWFTKLPPKIESLLLGSGNSTNTTATVTKPHTTATLSITTAPGPVMTGSSSSSSGVTTAAASSSSTSSSAGGAAVASAVFGAGMMGAMGVLGVLAL